MLYEPSQFEPLIDEPWDAARVEEAIAAIVADADAAFDPAALWPAHEWDAGDAPLPLKNLYVGASGVISALDALRRRGRAEPSLDLAAAALRTLELFRVEPDIEPGETHYHPAALLLGETGPLLVAFKLAPDAALAADLQALLPTSAENPTDDINWGLPGTLLALPGDARVDGRVAVGGGGARVGFAAPGAPRRGRSLAPGRRLPRSGHAPRSRRQHPRAAPPRAERGARPRDGGRSRPACGP